MQSTSLNDDQRPTCILYILIMTSTAYGEINKMNSSETRTRVCRPKSSITTAKYKYRYKFVQRAEV